MTDTTQPRKGLCCLLNKFIVRISQCPNSEFGYRSLWEINKGLPDSQIFSNILKTPHMP